MIKWNYFLYRFSYSHLTIRKCKKRKRREREREMIDSYFEWRRKGKKMLEMRKRGKKCTKSGVWWGEARERAHLKIEWSGRNCSRPRAGGREKRIFVARAMASGIRLLNVFIALERAYVRTHKRVNERAGLSLSKAAPLISIDFLSLPSSFVFCPFPSIIVNAPSCCLVAFHFSHSLQPTFQRNDNLFQVDSYGG